MPRYNPEFSKSFEQITDERAQEMRELIQQGKKLALMYSGGMDSTLILVALLKNLTEEELKSVAISTSIHAVLENPTLWKKHIWGKFTIFNSVTTWYDELIAMGYIPITGDEGDCLFGTTLGLEMYDNLDAYINRVSVDTRKRLSNLSSNVSNPDVHFSVYKDVISLHLSYDLSAQGQNFGRLFYEKIAHNIETSSVPVHSLNDFFWWTIFNVKYTASAARGAIFYNGTMPIDQCMDSIISWFNSQDYQLWSMVNNNNGEKIRNTLSTYKYTMRKYIHDFDKNDWYFYFKTKLSSLENLGKSQKNRENRRILGIDHDYQRMLFDDTAVQEFFRERLVNYKIDWSD